LIPLFTVRLDLARQFTATLLDTFSFDAESGPDTGDPDMIHRAL
jgi:hypothetical protein